MPNEPEERYDDTGCKDDGGRTERKKSEAWSVCMAAWVRVEMIALD
jgi:hypothetical protein